MVTRTAKPKTVAEYIAAAPTKARKKLNELRKCLRKSAPGAVEELKWSMPAVSYKRILVMYAGFKHHVGFYPTPSAIKTFAKELSKYKTAKGSIQFPLEQPLPVSLIKKIVLFRVRESVDQDGKWKA